VIRINLVMVSMTPAVVLRITEASPYLKDASIPQYLAAGLVFVVGLCKTR
jgi:hypothetical protein